MFSRSEYDSPAKLKALLDGRGLSMQKRFGQNFLVNPAARERIAEALKISPGMGVWEIGAGLGALTIALLDRGASVTAFEIDRGFVSLLEAVFEMEQKTGRFALVAGDALKTWRPALASRGMPERFCGNLPYNIAAVLIGNTIEAGARFERCVFTVQKEVAARMSARPGEGDYSSFSVLCQWAYRVTPLFDLAPGNFWPCPGVASTVVALEAVPDFPGRVDPARFARLIRAAFASRRKTLKNNLAVLPGLPGGAGQAEAALANAGIDPGRRAETVDAEGFLRLYISTGDGAASGKTGNW
ncbi:MAG: 16S rRNA (adenine(1518)-N(6)/adenine(1519)-N(6))-dimethyltransferase RsmA [Treponema sp.]|nr:16S rRNA (adenine(1518)-N(6)/adenine(1519)-N(6))-dimethyltransferase RsmA [Treponema sp.]